MEMSDFCEATALEESPGMPASGKIKNSYDIIEKIKTMPALESFDENDLKELLRVSKIRRASCRERV